MFRNPVRSIPVENKITDWYFCSNFPKQQVSSLLFFFRFFLVGNSESKTIASLILTQPQRS